MPQVRHYRRPLQAVPAGHPMITDHRRVCSDFTLFFSHICTHHDWVRRFMGRLRLQDALQVGFALGYGLLMLAR